MHAISVAFGPTIVMLLFKTKESAESAQHDFKNENAPIDVTDDYGQRVQINRTSLHGIIFEDMEITKLAHVARAMHNAHVNALVQKTAQTDPVLRNAAMMAGNVPMLSPMGGGPNGGMRQF